MSENAKNWVKAGFDVTVVTCVPNYPRGKILPGYRNRLFQSEMIDGVRVIRLLTLTVANEGVLLRTMNYLVFSLMAILFAGRLPKCDVVMSTSPNLFCGAAGWAVARLKRVPWVLEIRDLWPQAISAVGAVESRAMLAPFHALERWAYSHADLIVTVTRPFVDHIRAHGGRDKIIQVIPNGVSVQRFVGSDGAAFRERHGLGDKVIVSYVGTHGLAQKLASVLQAAKLLRSRSDIVVLMIGDGGEKKQLMQMQRDENIDNVVFMDEVPMSAIPDILAATDITLAPLSKDPLFRAFVPGKIFESMAAKRPVVLAAEGEAARLVTEAEAGIAVAPEDPEAMARAIAELADNPDLRRQAGENGHAYVRANFDREALSGRYAAVLSELVSSRRGKIPFGTAHKISEEA
ncbi:glycosyltransferase family 4 protein [Alsobacter sp. SYSU M60028]|uniref:Glycosyltransferase family 4 protein n=2 Tax=Alsobacter ponti TaxID=2962936 RepID=A0ABT1LBS7_9HYPH|nr:glycosyltransferase family 4 protein [Alsobacter ponti]MCP8938421.1 glycosyltransferase family 4 protein [Alsobacter ponti]